MSGNAILNTVVEYWVNGGEYQTVYIKDVYYFSTYYIVCTVKIFNNIHFYMDM